MAFRRSPRRLAQGHGRRPARADPGRDPGADAPRRIGAARAADDRAKRGHGLRRRRARLSRRANRRGRSRGRGRLSGADRRRRADRGDPRDDRGDRARRIARARRSHPLRALVPQFPRDEAVRYPLLPRRGRVGLAGAGGGRARSGPRLLGQRRRDPRGDRGRPRPCDLPHPPQPRAARPLRIDR